jgi:hypothetical protein
MTRDDEKKTDDKSKGEPNPPWKGDFGKDTEQREEREEREERIQ